MDDSDPTNEKKLAAWREEQSRQLSLRSPMFGRCNQTAIMTEGGTLLMSSSGAMEDGQNINAHWDVQPGGRKYAQICMRFALEKCGDSGSIEYRRIDGRWVNSITGKQEDLF